jgi:photosystem II stability/assembly factor-like uncharacterized protein
MVSIVVVALLWCNGPLSAAPEPRAGKLKDNLYGVDCVSAQACWAVGGFGTIVRTTDHGATWKRQGSHTTQPLYDVDFADAQEGWVVGRSGLILHTADGGETWEQQQSDTDKHLFSVDFVGSQVGVAAGDWGAIVTTNDGGKTWVQRALAEDVILNDVSMVDGSHGFIVGELGKVFATEDGGVTWTQRPNDVQKSLFGCSFLDRQHGFAVGIDALIIETADAGATWRVLNGSTEIRALEQVGFAMAYESPSLYSIAVDGKLGIAVGEVGAVFLSTDGGQTWKRRTSEGEGRDSGWYRAISLATGADGMIVGAKGDKAIVTDGEVKRPSEDSRAAEALH